MMETNDWKIENNHLVKTFSFKSYLKNISFVNAIAFMANKLNHHPELLISYNSCKVMITTHDQDGITDKDYQLAKVIDDLYL